jgi:hypothetical protein
MLGQFLSAVGGNIGGFFGGGILSTIGRYAGRMAGNYLERKWQKKRIFQKYSNLKDGFILSTANYGSSIPLIFGKMRCHGKIIWADKIKEASNTTTTQHYFSNSKQVQSSTNLIELKYYLSFAMAICEGEILEIARVWDGDELIDISHYKFRIYNGKQDQPPDPLIVARNGKSPAFRDLAYIVFEDLPLGDFDDCIPNLSFEVTRKPNAQKDSSVEDIVKSIIMIPGSGEYVYDTKVQTKTITTPEGVKIKTIKINSHNLLGLANSISSLNQLQQTCENVEWVSPVVCWFGSDVNAGNCLIRPAIEFNNPQTEYSENWRVANYSRNNAYEISKDQYGHPKYGGSVNDASVIRYLIELRSRGLKIMFYPMFFLDVEMKPWRGRVTGSPNEIRNFFRRPKGYNEFILHYARLVKDHVDAFVIGSELIGLTRVRENNEFPAVTELINLANMVKQVVGNNVLVTYAADWSEYHHTEGGWFNLDPLWSSDSIDFIGIDAYFPVTRTASSIISSESIATGWMSGEGYDYYVDHNTGQKKPLSPEYAWKNLRYWWENTHKNPDQTITSWQPKSKQIWFTEFGFPSIDKATNQPNVFFDPLCLDGGVPRESSGEVDFSIQRRAIRSFLEYWQEEEYIGQMFLWTWDARPYPAWPHMNIWRDGYLWEKGHWVNNKFGACSVASIILEISKKCGIDIENIEVSTIDEAVEGFMLVKQLKSIDAIDILRTAYFFDITACNDNLISFIKRGVSMPISLKKSELIKLADNSFLKKNDIPKELIINKINLSYINQQREYITSEINLSKDFESNRAIAKIHLPLALSLSETERLGEMIIENALAERSVIEFILLITSVHISVCDVVLINFDQVEYQVRIISSKIKGLTVEFTGIIDDIKIYYTPLLSRAVSELVYQDEIEPDFFVADIPLKLANIDTVFFAVYLSSNKKRKLSFKLAGDITDVWHPISTLSPASSIAKVIKFEGSSAANPFLLDTVTKITIKGYDLENNFSNFWQFALIGGEIIRFQTLEKIAEGIYQISNITRGEYGTEKFIDSHGSEEYFIFLEKGGNIVEAQHTLVNQLIILKIDQNLTKEFIFKNRSSENLSPFITKYIEEDNKLKLAWVPRNSSRDGWRFSDDIGSVGYIVRLAFLEQVRDFEANTTQIEIDLSAIDLSAGFHVSIIKKE